MMDVNYKSAEALELWSQLRADGMLAVKLTWNTPLDDAVCRPSGLFRRSGSSDRTDGRGSEPVHVGGTHLWEEGGAAVSRRKEA